MKEHKPTCIGFTPPCEQFSILQRLSSGKKSRATDRKNQKLQEAYVLLEFAVRLARYEHQGGRYFLSNRYEFAVRLARL